jgi:hypothetical protein
MVLSLIAEMVIGSGIFTWERSKLLISRLFLKPLDFDVNLLTMAKLCQFRVMVKQGRK